jgi:hypothetical protein
VVRFRASLAPPVDPLPLPLFGVIRTDALRQTPLQAGYAGCDRALLTELSLYGRFHEIPEPLFLQREHKDRAGPALSRNPGQAVEFWLGKQSQRPGSPSWQSLSAYSSAVFRAPLRIRARMRCYGELLAWIIRERGGLVNELIRCAAYTPVLGPGVQRLHEKYRIRRWQRDIRCLVRDIESLVPEEESFILVDEGNFVGTNFLQRHPIAFLEREGQYWGPPANDSDAICALDEMRKKGAGFLVVAWPAFWWMDYYREWAAYIRSRFPCIEQNQRIRVFDLRNIVEHSHSMPAGCRKAKGGSEAGKGLCY